MCETELSFSRPEHQPDPGYDGIFVHGYWLSADPGESGFQGGLRFQLALRAAASLFHNEQVGEIVVASGFLLGTNNRSGAEIAEEALVSRLGVPAERVIAEPVGYGTAEELEYFMRVAQELGWGHVVDIAFDSHYKTIRRYLPEGYSPNGIYVEHRSVEQILLGSESQPGYETNPRAKEVLLNLIGSEKELGFKAYQLAFAAASLIPGMDQKLYARNKAARGDADGSPLNNLIARTYDVFHN